MSYSFSACLRPLNILCGALLFTSISSFGAAATGTDPVVATGKGFDIKRSQLDDAFLSYTTSMAANGRTIPEESRADVRSNLLQHLIINHLLMQQATDADKAQTKKLVDDSINEARTNASSEAAFNAQIKATGMTVDQVRTRAYEEQLCRRVLEHDLTNSVVVTDAEAKKFYDENTAKFEVPEEVRVSHILVSTMDPLNPQRPLPPAEKKEKEKLAKDIKARADKGEDFLALVKQYSEDPGSKNKGGEYKFPRGQMVPEFEAAAFTLKVNQISDPVETQYGYHIIKCLQKYPAKHEAFDEEKTRIKDFLREKQAETGLPAFLQKLKKDGNVAVLDPETGKAVPAPALAPASVK